MPRQIDRDPPLKACPRCFAVNPTARLTCSECGDKFPVKARGQLKHCPFCARPGTYRIERRKDHDWITAGCPHGHAESPEFNSFKEAAAWWNYRPRPKKG